MTPIIYVLCEPGTDDVRYVGQSCLTPKKRLTSHCSPSQLIKNTHKNNWIKSLLAQNKRPDIHVVLECEEKDLNVLEHMWIVNYRILDCDLTNGNEGGGAKKGRKISEWHKERLIASIKGKALSAEHRAKISASKMGHIVSIESAIKTATAHKNNLAKMSEEEKSLKFGYYSKNKTWKLVDGKRVWMEK